jgi:hypothetical protein
MDQTGDSGVNLGCSVDSTPDQKIRKCRYPLRKYSSSKSSGQSVSDSKSPNPKKYSSKTTSTISPIKHTYLESDYELSQLKLKSVDRIYDLNQSKTIILFDEEGTKQEKIVPKMNGTPHPQKLFFNAFAKQQFIAEKNLKNLRENTKVARNLFLLKDNNKSLVEKFDRLNTQEEFCSDDETMKE